MAAPVNREVDSGIGGVARTAIGLTGAFDVTSDAMAAIGAVRDVLAVSLQKRLRDELGGTYSVSVSLDVDVVPPARWIITIDFTAAPERVESLTAAAFAEIERLRIQGPTTDEFTNTRAARIRDYDGEIDDNDYWTSELSSHSRFGWSLASIAEHQREAERLTLAELRVACAAYIPNGRYVRVTMRPHAVRGSTSAR